MRAKTGGIQISSASMSFADVAPEVTLFRPRASNPAQVSCWLGLTLCESGCDTYGQVSRRGAKMDEGEGVVSSTQDAVAEAAKAGVEAAKSAQEVVADAAKATVEVAKEVVSTDASALSEAVGGTTEKPRKAKRARGGTKKRASTAARPRKVTRKSAVKKPARKAAPARGRTSTKARRSSSAKSRRGSRRGR
jgi:hypothetical protein